MYPPLEVVSPVIEDTSDEKAAVQAGSRPKLMNDDIAADKDVSPPLSLAVGVIKGEQRCRSHLSVTLEDVAGLSLVTTGIG